MLQGSYSQLDGVGKLSIQATSQSSVLLGLIETEIGYVKEALCNLTPGPDLTLEYAISQQRLLCLFDLKDFFERVRKESMPQLEE